MRVSTAELWLELRRKYYLFQVYVCLANSWVKFMIVPAIFSVSSSIIVAFYVSIRHTEIPILIYLRFASVGVSLFVILFWFGLEVIKLIQSTEAIVETLNSKDPPYFMELAPTQRL